MEVKKYNIKKARKIQVRLFEKFLKMKGVYGKFIKGFNSYYSRFNESYYRFKTWNYDYYSMYGYITLLRYAEMYGYISKRQRYELYEEWEKFVKRYKRIKKSKFEIYGK
jgi:hypothetical protein